MPEQQLRTELCMPVKTTRDAAEKNVDTDVATESVATASVEFF
jgi:hypothetical protein